MSGSEEREDAAQAVGVVIGQCIERIMGEELPDNYYLRALADLGLDSIGGVDLSVALEDEFGVEVDPSDIRPNMKVNELANMVVNAEPTGE